MNDLVVIRTYQLEYQAELARAILEASEIPAVVLRDNAGGMLPALQIFFPIRLAVRADQAEAAVELLDDDNGAEDEPPAE